MAVKCDQLILSPINAISFKISGGTKTIIPHTVDGNITSLENPDGIFITLGSTMSVGNFNYKVSYIIKQIKNNIVNYEILMFKRTKSSTFILPMLGGNRKLFLWNKLFVNAHLDGKNITLVYRNSDDILFEKFVDALKTFKNLIETEKINEDFIYFTLQLPRKYYRQIKLFKNGKYSKLSDLYKLKILSFHNMSTESVIAQILFKHKKRKLYLEKLLECTLDSDIDLLSKPDNEQFNIELYETK